MNIVILLVISLFITLASAGCNPTYKYYIQLQSNSTNRYLQSSDLSGNAVYRWVSNSTVLSTFSPQQVNDRLGYFFYDSDSSLLYNDYYQVQLSTSIKSNMSNSVISVRLANGSYVNEKSNYYVSFGPSASTFWKVSILNDPINFNSTVDYLYHQVKIYVANSTEMFDVSGTTNYTTNYNGSNKIINLKPSNLTSDFNSTFTIIPVQSGKLVIQDSYGNYLSSDPTRRSAFTVQHMGDWEKMNFIPVSNGTFKIQSLYGWFNASQGQLALNSNSAYASIFRFEIKGCISPNVTDTPIPTSSPNITDTPIPTSAPYNCSSYCIFGYCNNNNTCICYEGFSGLNCSIPLPTSSPNVTVSPTSAPYNCSSNCVFGYCNNNTCVCYEGFSGFNCSIPLPTPSPNATVSPSPTSAPYNCSSDCVFGYCNDNNTCICYYGYYGLNCSIPLPTESPTPSPNVTTSPNVTDTPTPTSSPTQTPIPNNPITCINRNDELTIESNQFIECIGTGATYCEDLNESSCSTDSQYGRVICTTRSNFMKCKGGNIVCKSSYLTCSVDLQVSNSVIIQDSSVNN